MNIGIVGLGLIGGSFLKAVKAYTSYNTFAFDKDESILKKALNEKYADAVLSDENIALCDFLIIALYPDATIKFLEENASKFNKSTIVFDSSGTKEAVCNTGNKLADKYGFTFIGAHPMAGIEPSGFDYSFKELFKNASFIIAPKENEDSEKLEKLKNFVMNLGFSSVTLTTPCEHDKVIAYTSQLAHIVSSAYIKSPTALLKTGFTAGSFKDMTRVAYLNEDMWTKLFLENKEHLLWEINELVLHLTEYKNALGKDDKTYLRKLLKDGRLKKEQSEES